jgi:hypothetical protein
MLQGRLRFTLIEARQPRLRPVSKGLLQPGIDDKSIEYLPNFSVPHATESIRDGLEDSVAVGVGRNFDTVTHSEMQSRRL